MWIKCSFFFYIFSSDLPLLISHPRRMNSVLFAANYAYSISESSLNLWPPRASLSEPKSWKSKGGRSERVLKCSPIELLEFLFSPFCSLGMSHVSRRWVTSFVAIYQSNLSQNLAVVFCICSVTFVCPKKQCTSSHVDRKNNWHDFAR